VLIRRLLGAICGNAGVSLVSLIAGLLLLKQSDAGAFGTFAIYQTLVALGYGISNAAFAAPLTIAIANGESGVGAFDRANLLACAAGAGALLLATVALGATVEISLLLGISSLLHWLRWYAKSVCAARQEFATASFSDAIYTVIAIAAMAASALVTVSLASVTIALIAAAAGSFLATRGSGFSHAFKSGIHGYFPYFKRHGRPALVGVLSTEATTNAHGYLVTAMFGPAAFAPIAAAQLLFRPVGVALTALTQFERPRLAHDLLNGSSSTWSLLRAFVLIVTAGYIGNLAMAYVLMKKFPVLLGLDQFSGQNMWPALHLTACIVFMRCVRAPLSLIMQAGGDFSRLATATLLSSCVALPLVFLFCRWEGATASLYGVLAGEVACLGLLVRARSAASPSRALSP
jgi:hypothetical protein